MNGISGINSSMYLASGSLATHSVGMQVAAHNIANISTNGFLPQQVTYATSNNGFGVELESVRNQDAPLGRQPVSAQGNCAGINASGTEIAKEIPQMIATQRGFEANAATIRAADEMLGSVLNIIA